MADGKLTNITTWKYDTEGRVMNKIYANSQTNLTYAYDANGRLTNRVSQAKGTTAYSYDDVGNLTLVNYPSSPDVTMSYDALNRLTNEVKSGLLTNSYAYTAMGLLWTEDGPWLNDTVTNLYNQWSLSSETRYIYDGMRVIQERSGNTPAVSYTRGLDLSLSLEGAGGIGGLLARSSGYSGSTGNWSTHVFYHADGNGNVTYVVKSDQTMGAQYRYDP